MGIQQWTAARKIVNLNEPIGNETFVLVWHEVAEKLSVEYKLGYSNFEYDSQKGDFVYSFVTEFEINDLSGVFVETCCELTELEVFEASVDPETACQFSENFEFELAASTGLNHKMIFAMVGISWRMGDKED